MRIFRDTTSNNQIKRSNVMGKRIILLLTFLLCFIFSASSFAGDVYVRGYTRRNGTYVPPHVRSSPDSSRSNNYGPSQNNGQLLNPRSRDYNQDGTPNYLDQDDDNDSILDNQDRNQYSPNNSYGSSPYDNNYQRQNRSNNGWDPYK